MPRRKSNWTIHETKNGWDLSKGGRYYYNGLASAAHAAQRLRNYYKDGEGVFIEEKDGYRTNVTTKWKKSGLI